MNWLIFTQIYYIFNISSAVHIEEIFRNDNDYFQNSLYPSSSSQHPQGKRILVEAFPNHCHYLGNIEACVQDGNSECTPAQYFRIKKLGPYYICVPHNRKWNVIEITTLADCVEIGLVYGATSGYYSIIGADGIKNIITYCDFEIESGKAYTLLVDVFENEIIADTGYKDGYLPFSDSGAYYNRIAFKKGGRFIVDFDVITPHRSYRYTGFAPHIMALRFSGTSMFGDVCPEGTRGVPQYPCEINSDTWARYRSLIQISTLLFELGDYVGFYDECSDEFPLIDRCYKNFFISLSNLPDPDVRVEAIIDYETSCTNSWLGNRYLYDFRIYGTYEIPLNKYAIRTPINQISYGNCSFICANPGNCVGEGLEKCISCNISAFPCISNLFRWGCRVNLGYFIEYIGSASATCHSTYILYALLYIHIHILYLYYIIRMSPFLCKMYFEFCNIPNTL